LFQSHRQAEALPWLSASADRGEPRALYMLGVATYNGEFVPKDPVRAYALMTRAAGTGLAPASDQPCLDERDHAAQPAADGRRPCRGPGRERPNTPGK
jgi:hypothetical protein